MRRPHAVIMAVVYEKLWHFTEESEDLIASSMWHEVGS